MDEQTEKDAKPQIPKRNATITEIKRTAALLLNEQGMGPAMIGRAIERHEKHVAKILPELRKESLRHPSMVKLASKTVKAVMQGFNTKPEKIKKNKVIDGVMQEVEETIQVPVDDRIKASDAMRAAELVYSRAEPVKVEAAAGDAPSFTSITINQQFFGNEPQLTPQHVVLDGEIVAEIPPK